MAEQTDTALATRSDDPQPMAVNPEMTFSSEQVKLIRTMLMGGKATREEIEFFLTYAKRLGLDPIAKQIHFGRIKGKPNILVGIDGYRLIAKRSGEFLGKEPTLWCGPDGQWDDKWLDEDNPPAAARVTIHNKDGGSITATVMYAEAVQTTRDKGSGKERPNFFWQKMPALMLGKCAESQALRQLVPDLLSGTYTLEEMPAREDWDNNSRRAVTTSARPAKRLASPQNGQAPTRRTSSKTAKPANKQAAPDPELAKPTDEQVKRLFALAEQRGVDLTGYTPTTVAAWKHDMERLRDVEAPPPDDDDIPVADPGDDTGHARADIF